MRYSEGLFLCFAPSDVFFLYTLHFLDLIVHIFVEIKRAH